MESGGDNLTATFSSGLVDVQIFVVDVAGGDKVPRKGGPGVTFSDLLVVNKTDLAPFVGADLEVMRRDAAAARGDRPTVLISLTEDPAATDVLTWVHDQLRSPAGTAAGRHLMHSEVLLVARANRLPRIECRGGIAARCTHADTVHLVSAAATPLGGDTISVRVVVEPGARLLMRSAAATVILPGAATAASHTRLDLEVAGQPRRRPGADRDRRRGGALLGRSARNSMRQAACGCGNASRSAGRPSAKAFGAARCASTSRGSRYCDTGWSWAAAHWPTTRWPHHAPASANCVIPQTCSAIWWRRRPTPRCWNWRPGEC